MIATSFTRYRSIWLTATLLTVIVLSYVLEQRWPSAAWWVFLGLSLTLGMSHGGLDILLMLGQFKPLTKAGLMSAAYALVVVALVATFMHALGAALLVLLAMSVWHFGELYASQLFRRLIAGGASVMLPMLLAPSAMATLLQTLLGPEFAVVWPVWSGFAYLWLLMFCVGVGITLFKHHQTRQQAQEVSQQSQSKGYLSNSQLFIEVAVLAALNLILSPLMAFALYFGLYHSLAHIARVQSALTARGSVALWHYFWMSVVAITAVGLLLAFLWWALPQPANAPHWNNFQALQWLIVSLTAVTLPHLVLVGYSHRWLNHAMPQGH
jgi:Brp/Blh family beta-carotene 15,15'-monooxygenase